MRYHLPLLAFIVCSTLLLHNLRAQTVVIKNDNGTVMGHNTTADIDWEESVFLVPGAPCTVTEVRVYLDGTQANTDTVWIVGDPSEGTIPPTHWVWAYNSLTKPVVVEYDGKPGWRTLNASNGLQPFRVGGFDRVVVQHRVKENGPWFGKDNTSSSVTSYLLDPRPNPDFYNIAGTLFYRSAGNLLVQLVVDYGNTPPGSKPLARMVDVTQEVGLVNEQNKVYGAARVSVVDWDSDGWDDVCIGSNFYHNEKGKFKRVNLGISAGGGSVWGDYNNDGFIDCYAINGGSGDKLWKNKGDGTFSDVTAESKLTNPYPTVTPLWLDYNHDGKLDLFIANGRTEANGQETYFLDKLWRNNGDGSFTDVTATTGIPEAEQKNINNTPMDCWAASACDIDNDGWVDIFVASYRLMPDRLYRNNHDGTFSDVSATLGVEGVPTEQTGYFGHGAGSDWGDYDNDGDMDLIVGNLGHPDSRGAVSNPSLIYRNDGNKFTEVHHDMGLKFFEMNFGATWVDVNLDSYLDVWHCQYAYNAVGGGEGYRRSRMYLNREKGKKLEDLTWELGCDIHGAWTCARIDYDNDGDPDIIAASPTQQVKLFSNELNRSIDNGKASWIALRLKAAPNTPNIGTDCYGSSVTVYVNGMKITRDLQSGGYGTTGSQNSNELLFGLGALTTQKIDSMVVRYPDGRKESFAGLEVNSRYTLQYPNTIVPGKLAVPQLIAPANNQMRLPQDVSCSWSLSNRGAQYQLQYATTPDMQNATTLDISALADTKVLNGLNKHITYYWRVRALNAIDTTPWSRSYLFIVGLPVPTVPVLTQPANGAVDVRTKTLSFVSWAPSSHPNGLQLPISYRVQIATDSLFTAIYRDSTGINVQNYSIRNTTPKTKFWWHVKALNEDGESEWSTTWSYTTRDEPVSVQSEHKEEGQVTSAFQARLSPNPVQEAAMLHFQMKNEAMLSIELYNERGEKVLSCMKAILSTGEYDYRIDTSSLAAGVYSCKLSTPELTESLRLVVVR